MDTEEHRYDMQCEMCSPVVVGGSCSDLCADNLICPPVTSHHPAPGHSHHHPGQYRLLDVQLYISIQHLHCNTGSRSGSNHEQHRKNWLNCEIRLSKIRYRYQINAIIKLTDPVIIRKPVNCILHGNCGYIVNTPQFRNTLIGCS